MSPLYEINHCSQNKLQFHTKDLEKFKETAAELKKRREELNSAIANTDTCSNDIKVVNDFGGSEPL